MRSSGSVFISYADEDRTLAYKINLCLIERGVTVFFDREPDGSSYHARISREIKKCEVFIFLISPHSLSAGRYTMTELSFARDKWRHPQHRVLPVLVMDPGTIDNNVMDLWDYLMEASLLRTKGHFAAEVTHRTMEMLSSSAGGFFYRVAQSFAEGVRSADRHPSFVTPPQDSDSPDLDIAPATLKAESKSHDNESSNEPIYVRTSPEYWLHRVKIERRLLAGDEPVVMISFASADQMWIDELHAFIEPKLADLRDAEGRSYQLWNFSDVKRGTAPGDEFPEIVAEKMWRCRAAIIVLSRDFFRSNYCKLIELPFLMWRWEHHKLFCFPVKVGTVPVDKVRIPSYDGPSRNVVLDEIIDDRQAAAAFATSPHRNLNLKELKEAKLEAEIEKRFDGVGRRVVEYLKKCHGARDG